MRCISRTHLYSFLATVLVSANVSIVKCADSFVIQPASQIWLYSLVATDYNGNVMLPHFIGHYRALGIMDVNFCFDLLHDPAEADDGLKDAVGLLVSLGLSFSIISKPYTPALQDIAMMEALDRCNVAPLDWVIVADTDEMYTFDATTLGEAIKQMEAEGATFALGEMLDHVSENGSIIELQSHPSLWEQFPMVCPVTDKVAKGLPAKVTIHRGFLRVGAGHHHIVEPELSRAYFSKHCKGVQCEIVMKQYKQRSTVDLYRKTPYFRYRHGYIASQKEQQLQTRLKGTVPWIAKRWPKWTKVHHFKWHTGTLKNLYQRNVRDNGDCILGVNEDNCKPNFQFWKEVARQYAAVSSGGFNITALNCHVGLETFWNWR